MGQLGDFTIDQAAGSLALVLGSIGGLCLILFKSRCERISICYGLWSCSRKVQDEDKQEEDKKEEEIIPKKIKPLLQTDSLGVPIPSPQPEPEPEPNP